MLEKLKQYSSRIVAGLLAVVAVLVSLLSIERRRREKAEDAKARLNVDLEEAQGETTRAVEQQKRAGLVEAEKSVQRETAVKTEAAKKGNNEDLIRFFNKKGGNS